MKTNEDKDVYHIFIRQEKVHSLAPALTLTLDLILSHNQFANKLLWMNSTLYGLMYLTNGSTADYEYLIKGM